MRGGVQRSWRSRRRERERGPRTRPRARGPLEKLPSRRSSPRRARFSRSPRSAARCSGDPPLVPRADPSPGRWPPRPPRRAGERRCPSPDEPGCVARCSLALPAPGRPVPVSTAAAGAAERVVSDIARCGAGAAPRTAFGAGRGANRFAARRHDRAAWGARSDQGSCRAGSLARQPARGPPVGTTIRSVSRATDADQPRRRAVCASSSARSVHRSFRTGRRARCAVKTTGGCGKLRFPE